ncbi:MAG TPA: MFS transporter [Caulobacteraceae bacterium]
MSAFLARIYAFKFFDAFVLIAPLYTVMFVDAGLTPVQISAVLTAWSVTTFLLQAPSGLVADRFPRKWVLAGAQVARAAGFVSWWIDPHFWGFLIGLLLWGVKSAFTSGTFEALLYDELKAEDRAGEYPKMIGRARAVQAVATLSASLGAAGAVRFGYSAALAVSLIGSLACFFVAALLPAAPKALEVEGLTYLAHLRSAVVEAVRQPMLLTILAFSALVLALGQALSEFWPIFGAKTGLTRSAIALFVGAQSILEALANTLAHRVFRRSRRWFYSAMAGCGGLLVLAAAVFQPWSMVLLIVYSGVMKLVDTVFEGRLQQAVSSGNRATVGSMKTLAAQVGVTSLYLTFGPIAQATSYRVAFMAAGFASLAAGLGFLAVRQITGQPVKRPEVETV